METFVAVNTEVHEFLSMMNMPGILSESSRVVIAVHTGDAGIVDEVVQAAHNPTAGQIGLQAGEPVSALALPATEFMGFMVDMRSYMQSQAALGQSQALINGTVSTKMNEVVSTQVEMKAAQAEMKADVAQVQTRLQELDKAVAANAAAVASAAAAATAPGAATAPAVPAAVAPVGIPVAAAASVDAAEKTAPAYRINQKYADTAKQIVYAWLALHINHPYPNAYELAELCQQCDIADVKRMSILVGNTRNQRLVKSDGRGRRCRWALPRGNA